MYKQIRVRERNKKREMEKRKRQGEKISEKEKKRKFKRTLFGFIFRWLTKLAICMKYGPSDRQSFAVNVQKATACGR